MRHLILLFALAFAYTATAQPTWRFHLAFEDGTGARDTIWFVFDTTATLGSGVPDYELGEGAVQMDLDSFNVWILNPPPHAGSPPSGTLRYNQATVVNKRPAPSSEKSPYLV
ncbi:MAG: hypothetical protein JST45_10040 [Bacteroidetes bacterium]|nr:hypothetical protein [Bacteroidota bacterium]